MINKDTYKRLTETKKINEYCSTVECGGHCEYCYVGNLYERLAELEDKIENGTLLELPCRVGDKFYQVIKGLPIYEWEVETIIFSNIYFSKNYVITARRTTDLAYWKFWSEDFGKTIFLTKAEAEARLKELQENK